jgi:hypothetical protein
MTPGTAAPAPPSAVAPSGPPLTNEEKALLPTHLETFATVKRLVAQGKTENPEGVSGQIVCALIAKSLARYRESGDASAKDLVEQWPEVCGKRVPTLIARDALADRKSEDALACLTADDFLLDAEAEAAMDAEVVKTRSQWKKRCASFDRLGPVAGWLDNANNPQDKYRFACTHADERLLRFERAKQEVDAVAKQRQTWRERCT